MKSIATFRNRHQGQDVYVLGAGGSLNYLDREFFAGRVVIAVNEVAETWGLAPTYLVLKEHVESLRRAAGLFPQTHLIVARHPYGDPTRGFPPIDATAYLGIPNLYVFDHEPNRSDRFDAQADWPRGTDDLVVSMSTITSALHFAAYLGAANVIVVGHDCGQVGDSPYLKGYGKAEEAMGYGVQNLAWLVSIEGQSRAVKAELVKRYGCRVYGLSPFITPDLEGVPFSGQNRINA